MISLGSTARDLSVSSDPTGGLSVMSDAIRDCLVSDALAGRWELAVTSPETEAAWNSRSGVPVLLPTFTRFAASNSNTCSLPLNVRHLTQHSRVASFRP